MGRKNRLRAWLDELNVLKEKRQMVRFVRKRKRRLEKVEGFIGSVSEKFVFIHVLEPSIHLDGYTVIPIRDIKYFKLKDEYNSFAQRALALRGHEPTFRTDIDLTSFPNLLTSANKAFPLITIHIERIDPDICFIGRIEKLRRKSVTLRKVDPAAEWIGTRDFDFKDITRVDFGGGYEGALWIVASCEDEKRRKAAIKAQEDKAGNRSG